MTQIQIIVGAWFLGAMIILVSVWLLLRDIATHSYYQKKSEDGFIVAEFLSKVNLAFVELVKIENKDTGQFTYKGRKYFVGKEKVNIPYPPPDVPKWPRSICRSATQTPPHATWQPTFTENQLYQPP